MVLRTVHEQHEMSESEYPKSRLKANESKRIIRETMIVSPRRCRYPPSLRLHSRTAAEVILTHTKMTNLTQAEIVLVRIARSLGHENATRISLFQPRIIDQLTAQLNEPNGAWNPIQGGNSEDCEDSSCLFPRRRRCKQWETNRRKREEKFMARWPHLSAGA